jgi:protein-tyrosine phosphatase
MIDIHCHILAEVDDGPKLWDVSAEMCRMAVADGIEHIVATPHANHRYAYDRELLGGRLQRFQQRIGDSPRLSLGCDFHLSYENLQDVMVTPERYVIGSSRYLLAELSNYSIPARIAESFQRLMGIGVTPILTHPERNPILQRGPQQILQWVEMGCAVQLTASALTGAWGEMAWQTARWLLKRDAVHFLATDAHDTKRRPPLLSQGRDEVAELCGDDVARALVQENPGAVVSGHALPYFPQPVMKR